MAPALAWPPSGYASPIQAYSSTRKSVSLEETRRRVGVNLTYRHMGLPPKLFPHWQRICWGCRPSQL
jgi:hypothetical protein